MVETHIIEQLRRAGGHLIQSDGKHDYTLIPFDQKGVVFQQMFEYVVSDFEAEVGYYASVFGFPTIALTSSYALFNHPYVGFCFSFRKDESLPAPSTVGLKLLFMTADIPAAVAHLEKTGLASDRRIGEGSPVQQVIYLTSPAGVAIEIWEDPTPGEHANRVQS